MKFNAFVDLVFNWDKMSRNKKIQRLQDLENMIARNQGRKPRTIVTKLTVSTISEAGLGLEVGDRSPSACYSRHDKSKIYLLDLKQDVFEVIKDIIHEGFHAYVDDYLEGKVTLKLYSEVDKERFLFEEEHLPVIAEAFSKANAMQLYDSYYAEERLNYSEDTLYMLKLIFDSIENVNDAIKLQEAFVKSFAFYCDNEMRGRSEERRLGFKFDDMVLKALQEAGEDAEKCDISKAGKIIEKIEPGIFEIFKKIVPLYQRFASVETNVLMTESAKNIERENISNNILLEYSAYVKAMLKQKKKH